MSNQAYSAALQLLLWPLPWSLRRRILSSLLGYDLASDCSVGYSLILANKVVLNSKSRIGHFTVIRNIETIQLGESAIIGNFNKIAGVLSAQTGSFADEIDRKPEFIMGHHAALTNSHIVDCTNRVTIGEFATVAGWRCQILTHSIDISLSRQRSAPVSIGSFSFVGTGCLLLRGAVLPERSALSAGSVLASAETEALWVYSGVPAAKAKPLKSNSLYFSRTRGQVD